MLIHPTAERLRGLGLAAMAEAFLELQTTAAAAELSREDWLGRRPRRPSCRARTGSGCWSTARRPAGRTSGSLGGYARPSCGRRR
jgi:hypothetical protein